MAKTSGMTLSVTDDERDLIKKVQEATGEQRKPLIMRLIRQEAARLEK